MNFCCAAKWSVIYVYIHILFHYGLLQNIDYSSLCSIIGPCSLPILYIIVCIYESQTPSAFLPHSLSVFVSFFLTKVIVASLKEFGSIPFLAVLSMSLCMTVISKFQTYWHNIHKILLISSVFVGPDDVMISFLILILVICVFFLFYLLFGWSWLSSFSFF